MASTFKIYLLILYSLSCCQGQTTFKNPIVDEVLVDPSIVKHEGSYYIVFSEWNRITILKSPILSNFRNAERREIYRIPPEAVSLFSPEIHFIQGDLFIYFTMGVGHASRTMFAIKCLEPGNPLGEWSEEIKIWPEEEMLPTPGQVLQYGNDNLYFIWSGMPHSENVQNLYIAKMESPTKVIPPKVLMRSPEMDWERRGYPSNKAPSVIQRDGRTFLIFSASSPESPDYCLGLMGIDWGKDPMIPSNWWNDVGHCVFGRNDTESVWGTGDASFVTSPDDSETWMLHQAWNDINDNGQNRLTRIQKIEWEMNAPKFPHALGIHRELEVPGGE